MLCSDHIVRVEFKRDMEITARDIAQNHIAYNELVGGEKYPFIYYAEDGSVNYTEDARLYSKNNEGDFPKLCIAIVVETLAHKLVANFYIRFNRPRIDLRIFDKLEEAEAWCAQQYQRYTGARRG